MKRSYLVLLAAFAVTSSIAKATTVGFAQTGSESVWRIANSNSIRSEAEKRDITLKFVDAHSSIDNQMTAVRSFIETKDDVFDARDAVAALSSRRY